MSEALQGRLAQRQAFMEQLCDSLGALTGSRVSLEAYGGRGIAVLFDGGRRGTMMTRAAPWFPRFSMARDLTLTACNVADMLHSVLAEHGLGMTHIGPRRPGVTRRGNAVALQFFDVAGEALPVVEVPLVSADHRG